MLHSYELGKLDPRAFEHLVNTLSLRVLGAGATGFGPGPDGGRDGYYEGEAAYPSEAARWSGRWYIQSKFHSPHLSSDPQKWLLSRIEEEISEFEKHGTKRKWPDNWIIATNIDPSGAAETGAFDRARELVRAARPEMAERFHIWGGSKIADFLILHPDILAAYQHFLTPGHILARLLDLLQQDKLEVQTFINYLVVRGLRDNQHTKLEQAGSTSDSRPGLQRLFVDLPFSCAEFQLRGMAMEYLASAAQENHRPSRVRVETKTWRKWQRNPSRARVWFVKGGPGQGKSTLGQYLCQVHRAALALQPGGALMVQRDKDLAEEIRNGAVRNGFWPIVPRIPLVIELKDYAQWFGRRDEGAPRGVLTFCAERISAVVDTTVTTVTIRAALREGSWVVVFDGLDEVPHDVKDSIAAEVINFVDVAALELDCDLLTICTSRPQGYSGQFESLDAPVVELVELSEDQALACASPVVAFDRTEAEAERAIATLTTAVQSPSVRELMKSPLQSHIMAIIVRDGGRPPERRWQLFTRFYEIILRREANRELADKRIARLLREEEQLIKSVHDRLGFDLHARAETSKGAQTRLSRREFSLLVEQTVSQRTEDAADQLADAVVEATQERLVLVSTPDDGDHVRFDVRQLQEFFAAEFIYDSVEASTLRGRLEVIAGDQHWREVMHFLLSALIENGRRTELAVAVQVLMSVDGSDSHGAERLLRRRLGRGAGAVARLIQEGVLEQDKRYRQDVRPVLGTLGGITDPAILNVIANTSHSQSRVWLAKVALEMIHDSAEAECVGWLALLASLVRDDDPWLSLIADIYSRASTSRLAIIFECSSSFFEPDDDAEADHSQRKWLLSQAINRLTSSEWRSLGERGCVTTLELLRQDDFSTTRAADVIGLSALEQVLLDELLQNGWKRELVVEQIGPMAVHRHAHDWSSATTHRPDLTLEMLSGRARGILEIVRILLVFAGARSGHGLRGIIAELAAAPWLMRVMHGQLSAYIPRSPHRRYSDLSLYLATIPLEAIEGLLRTQTHEGLRFGPRFEMVSFTVPASASELLQLLEQYPDTAMGMRFEWYAYFDGAPPEWLTDPALTEAIVNAALTRGTLSPDLLGILGNLLAEAPPLGARLREALVSQAELIPEDLFWRQPNAAFALDLPNEIVLLPHVIALVLPHTRLPHLFRPSDHEDSRAHSRLDEVSSGLAGFVPDPAPLADIAVDSQLPAHIRGAANIALLLHPDTRVSVGDLQEQLIRCFNPEWTWYVAALVSALLVTTSPSDHAARELVGELLARTDGYPAARESLDLLLDVWREQSISPVVGANCREAWLAGSS